MDWIKVEDKLPEEGQKVIYYFKKVGVHVGLYNRLFGCDCFHGPNGFLSNDVSYWLPLPDPPGDE